MNLDWLPMSRSSMLDAAITYAAHRWPVFPVGRDKRPLVRRGFLDASVDDGQIRSWWSCWPDAGIGWHIPSTAVVVDIDARHRGHESLDELNESTGGSRRLSRRSLAAAVCIWSIGSRPAWKLASSPA